MSRKARRSGNPPLRKARLAGDVLAETPSGAVVMRLDHNPEGDDSVITVMIGSAVTPGQAAAELRQLVLELEQQALGLN